MANFWSIKEEEILASLVSSSADAYEAFRIASKQFNRTYVACQAHWSFMLKRTKRKGVMIVCYRKIIADGLSKKMITAYKSKKPTGLGSKMVQLAFG